MGHFGMDRAQSGSSLGWTERSVDQARPYSGSAALHGMHGPRTIPRVSGANPISNLAGHEFEEI